MTMPWHFCDRRGVEDDSAETSKKLASVRLRGDVMAARCAMRAKDDAANLRQEIAALRMCADSEKRAVGHAYFRALGAVLQKWARLSRAPAPHPGPLSHGTTFGSPGGEREKARGTHAFLAIHRSGFKSSSYRRVAV